ncbi:hypothetical protein ACFLZW_06110 [Chloroflexota bacterium]
MKTPLPILDMLYKAASQDPARFPIWARVFGITEAIQPAAPQPLPAAVQPIPQPAAP